MKLAVIEDTKVRQGELGQFLTPAPLADFMASLFGPLPELVRLLDAGAGAGALTTAFVSRCCRERTEVRAIEVTLYEVDSSIIDELTRTMQECEHCCSAAGIEFSFKIFCIDFIQEMALSLANNLFGTKAPTFDAAIVNPPYRKIGSHSDARQALRSIGIETSNLYTGFIAVIQRLLVPSGQLVGITPRSFCNGPYFRAFRKDLLAELEIRRLHVFESRKAAFRTDSVLQENVVFHLVKGRDQPRDVVISTSSGEPGAHVTESIVPLDEIVHPHDPQKFIHIPSATSQTTAKEVLGGLQNSLASLGISVSTGRVVGFRLKDALRLLPSDGTVPLIHPCHFSRGTIRWPKHDSRKHNAIELNEQTRPWLVPSGVYLLAKRFTSKEERRRLVACFFDPELVESKLVGFENHINYFHRSGQGLDRDLALGLFAYLNSTVVDQYFRRFSGHTQVNATDLRLLAYPDHDSLCAMGRDVTTVDLTQDAIDHLVANHLNVLQEISK